MFCKSMQCWEYFDLLNKEVITIFKKSDLKENVKINQHAVHKQQILAFKTDMGNLFRVDSLKDLWGMPE